MLSEQEYRMELVKVETALKAVADTVGIRGSGRAQFVFANKAGMSVEISRSDTGIWVEFWNTHDELPVHEATFVSYEQAIENAIRWLETEE